MTSNPESNEQLSPPPRGSVGHFLLLLLAVASLAEEILFFTQALGQAGRNQPNAVKFLILTIGVFLTALAAIFGFARTIQRPVVALLGLLLLQPAISVVASMAGHSPYKDVGAAVLEAGVGAALLVYVLVANRNPIGQGG